MKKLIAAAAFVLIGAGTAAAGVHIGLNFGFPPIFFGPPVVAVVPAPPVVYAAPVAPYYGGYGYGGYGYGGGAYYGRPYYGRSYYGGGGYNRGPYRGYRGGQGRWRHYR